MMARVNTYNFWAFKAVRIYRKTLNMEDLKSLHRRRRLRFPFTKYFLIFLALKWVLTVTFLHLINVKHS